MKPFHLATRMAAVATLLLASCGLAQEKSVALRGRDTLYVTTVAKGGLAMTSKEITGRETFVLTDLSSGDLAEGDAVRITWAPTGTRPTYWHEGEAGIDRVGTKPDVNCTFKVRLQPKVAPNAPRALVLQTASGKFVSVTGKNAALGLTDARDKAVTLEVVDMPRTVDDGKTATSTAPATTAPAPPLPVVAAPAPALPATPGTTPIDSQKPTLWLIGDSTVNNGTPGLMGWGTAIKDLFDPSKITVQNRARGGRSSRSFLTEGLWDAVTKDLKAGDYVLMQFGHNDGGKPEGVYPNGRASLRGNGDDSREVETTPGKTEVVQSYGWYLRRYIADAKAKGATPIVLSMVPRNDWKDGHVLRASGSYGGWAKEAAVQGGAIFVDLNEIIGQHYDAMGQDKVKAFFPQEHTHTSPEGAQFNAQSVVEGLKTLPGHPFDTFLKADATAG